jgi:dihydrodipicolinate synthase/N-acetylneuraminate lyase
LRHTSTHAYVGAGARILDALEAGARAGILAVAHVLPEVCARLFVAWDQGRRDVAEEMQAHARALATAFEGWTVSGVKWGLEHRGLPVGPPRLPLPPAPSAVQERVRRVIDSVQDLMDDGTF